MKKTPWWSWNVSPDELKEQVEQYDELSLTKSYRGQVVLVFLFIFTVSVGMSFLLPNFVSIQDVLIGFVIYGILIALGYFGHRWALIALLIYWMLDKSVTIIAALGIASGSLVEGLIFLVMGIVFIVRAIKVETERKNKIRSNLKI
ncbi:MAG TPA: hypothetical protein VN701_00285 [Candidatus Paceibacterota bacterium]|nr:hypothetical protein [Candidatus Paceibacterota bacterium]